MFFLETTRTHWVCIVLAGWFTYVYVQQKYCHLYLCKVVEYTEMTLDVCAMYFWGVPLSLIATASALWGRLISFEGRRSITGDRDLGDLRPGFRPRPTLPTVPERADRPTLSGAPAGQ